MTRVDDMFGNLRQVLRRHHQDVGAMLGKRARRHRPGQDARQVEHTDTAQRARPIGKRLWFALAELDDLDDRLLGERLAVRVRQPFGVGAHHGAAGACFVDCLFELKRIPAGDGFGDGRGRRLAAKHLQDPGLEIWQPEMRQEPAPVAGRPRLRDPAHRLVFVVDDGREGAVRPWPPQVVDAAQAGGGMAHVDCNLLAPAGLALPEIGHRDADTAKHSGAGLSDLEAGREHGIGADDGQLPALRHGAATHRHQLFECSRHCSPSGLGGPV